jgi:predicted  nucleic acid-binding Zn-ribbon protein
MRQTESLKSFFVFACLMGLYIHVKAQSGVVMYNATIIKMAKAKLSDGLIIDEINNSHVKFSFDADSLAALNNANVSSVVIQQMKDINNKQNPIKIVQEKAINPSEIPVKKEELIPKANVMNTPATSTQTIKQSDVSPTSFSLSVKAVSYVSPTLNLISFFDQEYQSLYKKLLSWDKQMNDSLQKITQLKTSIEQLEKELATKKNEDAKAYDNEILALKTKLNKQRETYLISKKNIETRGLTIPAEIQVMGNSLISLTSDKYSEVAKATKKFDADPALGYNPKSVNVNQPAIPDNLSHNIAAISQMLHYYRNQIIALNAVVNEWNIKANKLIEQDIALNSQLQMKESELNNLKQNSKANKKKIQLVKGEISTVIGQRKTLKKQMDDDCGLLSNTIKQSSVDVQSILKTRFADVVTDIKYCFQETL